MASRRTLKASFHIRYAQDGEAACILALSNEVEMVACDGLGNVSDVDSIEGTAWTFYVGNTALDASDYTYEVVADGCTVSTSVSGSVGTIAVTAMSADTATVTVKVTYNGTTYTREYTLTKNYANLSYHIVASPAVLAANSSNYLTTAGLDYAVRVYDNGTVTVYTDLSETGDAYTKYGLYLYYSYKDDDSYTRLKSTGYLQFGTGIASNTYSYGGLTLHLYQGGDYDTGTLVDQETLEVVKDGSTGADGADGADGDDACILALTNEAEMVSCDSLGNVLTLPSGTTWTLYEGNSAVAVSDCTYDVTAEGCTASVSTSGTVGTVSITDVSADTATVTIAVTYNGTTYTRTYTLTKVFGTAVYDLVITPGVLTYDADGNYTGGTLTVGVRVTEKGTSTIYYNLASTGALRTTYGLYVYRTVRNAASYTLCSSTSGSYTPSDAVAASCLSAGGLTFAIYKDGTYSTGTLQDEETLEVISDGAQGDQGESGNSVQIVGKGYAHFDTWAEMYTYSAGLTDTGVAYLCDETGDLSDSSTATGTGPYVHTVDSDGNYTVTLASVGDCYVVDSGNDQDGDGHVWYATADGWEDLGEFAGADAEYYELRDAATYSANYASAITAVVSSVADDGTITEAVNYALHVVLAHVKGDDISYITGATVTAYILTADGWGTVDLERSGNVYSYSTDDAVTGVDLSELPASMRVTATYNGSTYYLAVPVTLAASNYFSITESILASVYQNSTDIANNYSELTQTAEKIQTQVTSIANDYVTSSELTQTADEISSRVATIEEAGYATESYVDQKADEITSSVTSTLEGYATESYVEQTADTITATVQSTYSSAGLTITDDTIVLTASKVKVVDSDGNTVALFSDGKVSADLIDAESIFTTYLSASNAVLGNVTIEGSIVYAQHVLNKGTESTYLQSYSDTSNVTFDGVTAQTLDVCTLDGTLIVEEDVSFVLPYIDIDENKVVNSFVRGKTQFNSSTWREMSFSDFRRLLGRELTIINNSGAAYIKIGLGDRYFIGDDTEPTELTDGIYSLYTGRTVTFAIDYSTEYGYLWRASEASYGSESVLPEDVMASAGYYWDLPEECDSIDDWTTGEWTSAGTRSDDSNAYFCPSACIAVPTNATKVSIQTAATKTINSTTYHYTIRNIYAGTAGDSAASYLTDVTTLLSDGDTALTGTGTLKACDDDTVYRADVNVEGYSRIVVSFGVYTEGSDGLEAVAAELGTNVDLANLKILFY